MKKYFYFCLLALGLTLTLNAAQPNIFQKEGEVYINKNGDVKLTKTGGKIDNVSVSESGRYAAATKIVGYFEEHNDALQPGEKPEMEPEYHILILDLETQKQIAELKAPGELTHPMEWHNDKYRFGEGSELDIYAVYEYDPRTNNTRKMEFDNATGDYK